MGRQCRIRRRCGYTPKRLPAGPAYARAFARASKCARMCACVVWGSFYSYTDLAALLSLGVCEYVKRRFMRFRKCFCGCVCGRSGDRACICACVHVAGAMDVA